MPPPLGVGCPPQMSISAPVHTAVWPERPVGAPSTEVGCHMSSAIADPLMPRARLKATNAQNTRVFVIVATMVVTAYL
jgi:hypothetical protein